jgi:ribosomal protein S27AE
MDRLNLQRRGAPGTEQQAHGLACPRCGSDELPVDYTRDKPGRIDRRRECKKCGAFVVTSEKIRVVPPSADT